MTDEPTRILLIEDEPAHAELVQRAFEMSRRPVELVVTERLSEARRHLNSAAPLHLIISDWRLPDGEGLEILPASRDRVPVVIMTSQGNERVAVDALKAGALDYVVKSRETLDDMPHIAERAIREWNISTERTRIQAELRSSEERLRTVITNAPIIFWAADRQGSLTTAEGRGLAALGVTPAELVGRSVFEVYRNDPGIAASFQRALHGEAHATILGLPDNGLVFETWFSPLYDRPGSIAGVTGVSTDVTERKRAEEALRVSEQKFFRAFHSSPVGMIIRRLSDSCYLDVNNVFCEMTGYQPNETIGSDQVDLKLWISPADRAHAGEVLVREGSLRDLEMLLRRKSGEIGIVSMSAVIVEVGNEMCALVTLHDVTARRQAEEALRLSEEKFNKAFLSSPVAMAISDRTTRYYLDVNDAFARLTGYPRTELVGHTARDFRLWVDLRERERVLQLTEQQGYVHGEEIHFQNHAGEVRLALFSIELVDVNGVPCLLTTIQDITERRQAEDALRASEDRFRSLVQNSQDIITVHDSQGLVLYESPAVVGVLGYPASYLIGRSFFEFVMPEDKSILQRTFTEVIQRRHEGVPVEFRFRRADDSLIYLEALGSNLLDHPGVRGIVITSRDITERKLSEDALRQYTERLSILHEIDQAILSAKSIEEIADAVLSRIQRSVPSWHREVVLFDMASQLSTVAAAYYREQKLPAGERRPLAMLGSIAHLEGGQLYVVDDLLELRLPSLLEQQLLASSVRSTICAPLMVLGGQIGLFSLDSNLPGAFRGEAADVVREVADQLAVAIQNARLLEQTQRHADELEQRVAERTRELADANVRLTELDRLKSKFVSDVSHELRTPIANLKLHVELLEQGKPEKRAHYLTVVKQQARRLSQLVDDILNLSRLEISTQRVVFGPVDLNFVVEQIVTAHQPRAESRNLTLSFEPCAALPPVRGEVNQLAQVVTNLVSNALSYTPAGSVRVRLNRHNDEACLHIEDTGFGIDPDDLPNIFDRFYRGRRSQRSETPGTGLGLAIVKEIIDLHEGRIKVDSQAKQGTTVHVWLPLYHERAAPPVG